MENPIHIGKNNGNYINSQQMEMVKKYLSILQSHYLGIKDIIQVLKQKIMKILRLKGEFLMSSLKKKKFIRMSTAIK